MSTKLDNPTTTEFMAAVITRTKDRPIALKRVANVIANQTHKNFVWVIVNDGGNQDDVNSIANIAIDNGINTITLHHTESKGRSAAANAGVASSKSKYIAWLDDDDTWHKNFLSDTISFMENKNKHYEGVATHTQTITETIENNQFVFKELGDKYTPSIISIPMLINYNPIPINSFLHTRESFNQIGGFDEKIDYTEDWQFNVKFILRYNIGIIPKIRAFYHKRPKNKTNEYSNTITANLSEHQESTVLWKNGMIRESIKNGNLCYGDMLYTSMAITQSINNHNISRLSNYFYFALTPLIKIKRWIRKMSRRYKKTGLEDYKSNTI